MVPADNGGKLLYDGQKQVLIDGCPGMIVFDSIGHGFLRSSEMHQHDVAEISIYLSGSGVTWSGEQAIPFKKGTIVFYPPNVPHGEESKRGYTEYWILTKWRDPRSEMKSARVFQDTANGTLAKIASALIEEHQRENTPAITQDLFNIILSYLDRWEGRKPRHPLVDKLAEQLIKRMHEPDLEVGEVMKSLPMSIGHLREHFLQETGKTPMEFLTDLRITEAKRLLRRGFSVKAAGDQVGYVDPYYFSRIFFQTTGVRPSIYSGGKLAV